jgi:hypothetical protein
MSPTRVTPYLGGTGQINTAKINVHPTLQRVTIGADVLANSNLEVRGNSYANVAEGATTRFGNVFITNLSQVNPNADFQIAKSGNVTFNLFSTTSNVRQDFQAGSAQFSFLLFGGSPANLRMVAGSGVNNVTAEVNEFNFTNNVYVRGNLFVAGDTTVNNVIQTVEVANTQSANAYYLTKAATDISMSNGWTFSGSNVAHFAYGSKRFEYGNQGNTWMHGNTIVGGALFIGAGGAASYGPGAIYSDGNYGMLIRSRSAGTAAGGEFVVSNSADTHRLKVDIDGNVTVGPTHGTAKFNVTGNAYVSTDLSTGTGFKVHANGQTTIGWMGPTTAQIDSRFSAPFVQSIFLNSNTHPNAYVLERKYANGVSNYVTYTHTSTYSRDQSVGAIVTKYTDYNDHYWRTQAGSDLAILNSTGLGVGVSPAAKLHVSGNVYASTSIIAGTIVDTSASGYYIAGGQFVIQGSGYNFIYSPTGTVGLQLKETDSYLQGDFIAFRNSTGSTEYMRINSTGLGIGTSTIGTTIALPPTGTSSKIAKTFSPSHQAGNAGNVFIGLSDGGGFSGMYVTNDWGGTYSSQNVIFFTAQGGVSVSTERFKIDYNGVLLHNSSNVLLDGSSNIPVARLNGGLSANSSSYWRGDGTWATPAGGGGGSPWTETTGILYGTNTSSNVSIGSSTDFKTKLYVSGNAFVSSLMHISDNVVIGSTTTSNNRLTISGPDTTIPQIAFRSSDGNWWGRLGQVVNGATIGAFLSSGGSWSISGSTFSATKDLTGTFPTAALFIGNQYNSASETNFRFLSKAAGSTTSDGTITERMIIDGSGNVGIGTSTAYTKFHVSATSGAPASSGILTTGITIAEGVGGPSLNIGNYNSGGIYYSWIQSAFVNNAGVVQPLVLQQIGGVTNIGTATSLTDSGLTIQGSGVLQAWNTGLTGTTRRVWGVALEQATVGDFQLRMSTAANTKPSVARLAIDASGRVGIGPTTMTSNLQVTGNAYISANIVSSANVVGNQLLATNGFFLNANTLSANYTIAAGMNAVTVGPFVIPAAMNVTVSSDSYWVVL